MLSLEDSKRIGINACIDKMGREFVKSKQENSVLGYGECEDGVYCFIGVNDSPYKSKYDDTAIVLDSISKFKYIVRCIVNKEGIVTFLECVLPRN